MIKGKRKGRHLHPKVTDEMDADMKRKYEEGWTQARIARHFGVSGPTVRYHLDPIYRANQIADAMKRDKENPEKAKEDRKRFLRKHQWRYRRRTLVQKGKIKSETAVRGKFKDES